MLNKIILVGLATALSLLGAVEVASATSIVMQITAYIDGRDQLIIDDNTLKWHHLDFAAVGRHFDGSGDEPTLISLWEDGTQKLDNYAWVPAWPYPPPNEIRFETYSCIYSSLHTFSPNKEVSVSLTPLAYRYSTTIVQYPNISNGYQVTLDFNDNPVGGPAWYSAIVEIKTEPVPEPATMILFGAALATLVGIRLRKKK